MRTLSIGASGQLGNDLMRGFVDEKPVGVDHAMVDIEAPSAIAKLLMHHRPVFVIDTTSLTTYNFANCGWSVPWP